MGGLTNAAISAARSLYYSIVEPLRLKLLRALYDVDYDDREFIYNGPTPLISIVVPTFNRCDLLIERCLTSITAQGYPNWEVIVAAHGCTDGTVEKVKAFSDKFQAGRGLGAGVRLHGILDKSPFAKRIRVIEVPRTKTYPESPENHWFSGPVVPINAALRECRGAWVARNDDDDSWTSDHLEKLLDLAQHDNLEFVSSAYETERDGSRFIVPHDKHPAQPIGGVQTWLYRSYLAGFKANGQCWRKSNFRVNDLDLADRFRRAGVRIGHLAEVTAYVLPRPGEARVGSAAYSADPAKTLKRFAFD